MDYSNSNGSAPSSTIPQSYQSYPDTAAAHHHSATSDGANAPRPLTQHEESMLNHLDRLKFFLATAPSRWASSSASASDPHFSHSDPNAASQPPVPHPALNRFLLPSGEYVSCVLWNGLYHITGTDIVRALVFRFDAFGRPVRNMKKFEEGVFSDLRNLKPGTDACLEEPKSPFLDLLFKYQCIRTQKKQKVFYWFSVPHDRLFLDALERDLKREKMGLEPTTQIIGEPARSFTYDPKRSLFEQFSKARGGIEGEGDLERAVREIDGVGSYSPDDGIPEGKAPESPGQDVNELPDGEENGRDEGPRRGQLFTGMFSLFSGSPTYKQRRKKANPAPPPTSSAVGKIPPPPTSGLATADVITASDYDVGYGTEYPPHGYGVDDYAPTGYNPPPPQPAHVGLGIPIPQSEYQRHTSPYMPQPGPPMNHLAAPQHLSHHLSPSPALGDSYHGHSMHHSPHALMPIQGSPSVVPGAFHGTPGSLDGIPVSGSYGSHHSPATFPNVPLPTPLTPLTLPNGSLPPTSSPLPLPNPALTPGGKPKAFTCPLVTCSRTFKRMEHLKRHVRTHTMEKPYECDKCGKKFSRSDNLTQHTRTHGREVSGAPVMKDLDENSGEGSAGEDSDNMGLGDIDEQDLAGISSAPGSSHGVRHHPDDAMGVPMGVFDEPPPLEDSSAYPHSVPGTSYGSTVDQWGGVAQHHTGGDYIPHHAHSLPIPLSDNAGYASSVHEGSIAGSPLQLATSLTEPMNSGHHHLMSRRPRPTHANTTDGHGYAYSRGASVQPISVPYRRLNSGDFSHMGHDVPAPQAKPGYDGLGIFGYPGSSNIGPIRRHRSATPTIRPGQHLGHFNGGSNTSLFAMRGSERQVSHGYHPYLGRGRDFSGSSNETREDPHDIPQSTTSYTTSMLDSGIPSSVGGEFAYGNSSQMYDLVPTSSNSGLVPSGPAVDIHSPSPAAFLGTPDQTQVNV